MLWALAATTACGPRHVATATAPDPGPAVAAATRALDAGSCVALHEVLAELQHARSAGASPAAIDPLVVQVSAVLDIREVELGLVQHRHLDTLATPSDRPDLLSIVEFASAVRGMLLGPGEDLDAWQRGRAMVGERSTAWKTAWATRDEAVWRYAALGLECWFGDIVRRHEGDLAPLARAGQGLVAWKAATCAGHDVDALRLLVQRDSRFAEARYLVGLDALRMGMRTEAIANVQAALAILPEWPRALVTLGDAFMAVERFEDAIEAFDAALGLGGDAPARLGRVQALSYLERHDAAIAQADEMVARGTWYIGAAHYWKAWNLARLDRLDEAATEIAAAKPLMMSAQLLTLSGVVAFRRGQYPEARADLTGALDLISDNCDARFTLAAVEGTEKRFRPAAEGFAVAAQCFHGLETRPEPAGTEVADARVLARRERDRQEAHRQRGASHVHAAEMFAGAGDSENARSHLAALDEFPEWTARRAEIAVAIRARP